LAWTTKGVIIRYCGDLGLIGFDYKAQLISVAIAAEKLKGYKSQAEGWNWPMIKNDIIQVEAEQRLLCIAIAKPTSDAIDKAFDKLIEELIIITDLSISRRKPGVGKKRT
jgi:hypothetical protein